MYQAVENAAPDTKMPRSLFHILRAESLPLREGADHRLSFNGETPVRIGGGLPLLPLSHLNPGQTSASGSSWIKGQQSGI
jgi:hypothetical protein